MRVRHFALLAVFLAAASLRAAAPGVYAITGGTLHTAAGPDVPNGVVIIRDGLIEAAGAGMAVPPDAAVIDASGMHVYPGLIDAHTSFGFVQPKGEGNRPAPEPTPDALALRSIRISDDDASARRATGVTTIVAAPSYGIFNGQSVVLNLGTAEPAASAIKSPAALQISFAPRRTWTFPDSLMGVIAYIRQTLLDAQQHAAARAIYERNPTGLQRPADDAALDALAPVLRRELPVVFVADTAEMMRRAQAIAAEAGLRLILAGARQAYRMPDELQNVPLLVSVKWPTAPATKEDREDQPLRIIRDRQLQPTTPAVLVRSGVTFALVSGAGKSGDFLPGIRKAIDNGLSPDDALRATTLWPARIFGVDRQLGSLERGKIANVVVSDKPLFTKEAKVRHVFVDGREIRLPAEEKKQSETKSPIDGTWNVTVQTAKENVSFVITLRAEDGRLTGSWSGDRGSGDIRNGRFDGTKLELTLSAQTERSAETSDWVFSGTLSGDTISGSVSTTLGSFQFSGSRSK